MKKLIIKKIEDYNYTLIDDQQEYFLNLEFYDLKISPKENDYLYINEHLLKEKNIPLCFGPINSHYGKEISSSEDEDILIIVINQEKIYLKRYYG